MSTLSEQPRPASSRRRARAPRADVEIGEGLPPKGDVIFMSIDAAGSPGRLNQFVLASLDLSDFRLPDADQLAHGYVVTPAQGRLLCFIVTVGNTPTREALDRNLRAALRSSQLAGTRSLWIPLMGTGTGRLREDESLHIIRRALHDTGWESRPGVRIVISSEARTSPTGKQYDRYVEALLRFASILATMLSPPRDEISTRLLLFALALSDDTGAPSPLAGSRDALDFAAALKSNAPDKFEIVWEDYFGRPFRPPELTLPHAEPSILPLTANATSILRAAAARSEARKSPAVAVSDVVFALLEAPRGRHRDTLAALGVDASELMNELAEARLGRISLTLHNDVATATDRLGYECYAKAITEFITHTRTPPPISVSIQAPWGVGKSSLMRMIRLRLDPASDRPRNPPPGQTGSVLRLQDVADFLDRKRTPRLPEPLPAGHRWTVWFNAWKYETTEQVWAGLVDAIVDQVSARLDPYDRELFLLRLQLARIDDGAVRKRIYDRVFTIWWAQVRRWALLLGAAAASLVGLGAAASTHLIGELPLVVRASFTGSAGFQMLLAGYLAISYFASREKTKKEPASFSLSEFLKVPDYGKAVGAIHEIHADLLRVLSILPREESGSRSALVIFVDDLDRCAPSSVASVVEGVSSFLASELRCVFVIAMDPQMVAAALENAHAAVRERLPSFERSVPLGWRFMDKFIQLPFTIPPSNAANVDAYMRHLDGPQDATAGPETEVGAMRASTDGHLLRILDRWAVGLAALPRALFQKAAVIATEVTSDKLLDRPPPIPTPSVDATARSVAFEESRDVGVILNAIKGETAGNPRELKRLANLARFYLQLRNERRRRDATWKGPPPTESYARWIVLTTRWPDMMRWLLWGSDEALWSRDQLRNPLMVRRLKTLEAYASFSNVAEWRQKVLQVLNIPSDGDAPWLLDPKLCEFFAREHDRPPSDRLSAAAALEFW